MDFKIILISALIVVALVHVSKSNAAAITSSGNTSMELYEQGLIAKLLLARQSRSSDEFVRRSRQQYKKNLRDCETIQECKELFKYLINSSIGDRRPSTQYDRNENQRTIFKWGR